MYSVSVAMAAYNGEKYISEQIESIMKQLKPSDELIVSYNPSEDRTENIVAEFAAADHRIKAVLCKEKGVLKNFENAIRHCNNDIIFLADQDDVWVDDKVEIVLKEFQDPKTIAVIHGGYLTDENLNITKDVGLINRRKLISPANILWKNQVQGSCMAFRKDATGYFLPFPENIPMHDSWIGMVLSRCGKVLLIPDRLLLYRQHGSNVTSRKHGEIKKMLSDRYELLDAFCKRMIRINKKGK